jgi:SnoaL-like domain
VSSSLDERIAALERRVVELDDEREIRGLLSRYGFLADHGHGEEWVSLFEPHGSLEYAADPAWVNGLDDLDGADEDDPGAAGQDLIMHFKGHSALRAFIHDPRAHKAIEGMCLHIMDSNLLISIEGERATAESYNLTLVRRDSRMILLNGSVNRWSLTKTSGSWLIEQCVRRRPGAPGFDSVQTTRS